MLKQYKQHNKQANGTIIKTVFMCAQNKGKQICVHKHKENYIAQGINKLLKNTSATNTLASLNHLLACDKKSIIHSGNLKQ